MDAPKQLYAPDSPANRKNIRSCHYPPKELRFTEKWRDEAKSQHIYPTDLQGFEDGSIQFHVPKEKIDDSKREFKLKGHVGYITEEEYMILGVKV